MKSVIGLLGLLYNKTMKKQAILYGNCHMNSIERCLRMSKEFSRRYYIKQIPLFYEGGAPLLKKQLKSCRLFIYQEVRETNQFGEEYSTDRLKGHLSQRCRCVSIPNLYELGYGFFPQCLNRDNTPKYLNTKNPPFRGDERGLFVHVDNVIAGLIESNESIKDVLKKVKSGGVIPESEIKVLFDEYMAKIRQRESSLDIKIYDYLENNYRNKQVFNDFGHPSACVLKTISERVLISLGMKNDLAERDFHKELDEYEDPIYPCVAKALGLEYQKSFIREQSDKKLVEHMDFDEYVKEYYYWCQ